MYMCLFFRISKFVRELKWLMVWDSFIFYLVFLYERVLGLKCGCKINIFLISIKYFTEKND